MHHNQKSIKHYLKFGPFEEMSLCEIFIYKSFITQTEKWSGKVTGVLRIYGGEEDIMHEATTSYTSQHICMVERRNITILDMLKQNKNPHKLWDEVVIITNIEMEVKGSRRIWLGRKSRATHFKVFGFFGQAENQVQETRN